MNSRSEITFIGLPTSKKLSQFLEEESAAVFEVSETVTRLLLTIRYDSHHRGKSPVSVNVLIEIEGVDVKVGLHAPRHATTTEIQVTVREALKCALRRLHRLNEVLQTQTKSCRVVPVLKNSRIAIHHKSKHSNKALKSHSCATLTNRSFPGRNGENYRSESRVNEQIGSQAHAERKLDEEPL